MKLMTLGDSHSLFNFAGVAEARIYWRGPVTMHRAARDGIASLVPKNCRPTSSDILILSLGEIDSRVHIPRVVKSNGTTSIEEVNALCDRFKIALNIFRKRCPARIALSCLVPFNPEYLCYEYYPDADTCLSDAKRVRHQMNARMSEMGIPFIDFQASYSNADGSVRKEFSDGNVHIDPRQPQAVLNAIADTLGIEVNRRSPPGRQTA